MTRAGSRVIDGRRYLYYLGGNKTVADRAAAQLRTLGKRVRVFKVKLRGTRSPLYRVYATGKFVALR